MELTKEARYWLERNFPEALDNPELIRCDRCDAPACEPYEYWIGDNTLNNVEFLCQKCADDEEREINL